MAEGDSDYDNEDDFDDDASFASVDDLEGSQVSRQGARVDSIS